MTESLNAGNDFNADSIGVIVKLTQLLYRVSASHITEMRVFFGHLVHILSIEPQLVVAHNRHISQIFLESVKRDRAAKGYVEHYRKSFEIRCFFYFKVTVLIILGKKREQTVKMMNLGASDIAFAILYANSHFLCVFKSDLDVDIIK